MNPGLEREPPHEAHPTVRPEVHTPGRASGELPGLRGLPKEAQERGLTPCCQDCAQVLGGHDWERQSGGSPQPHLKYMVSQESDQPTQDGGLVLTRT